MPRIALSNLIYQEIVDLSFRNMPLFIDYIGNGRANVHVNGCPEVLFPKPVPSTTGPTIARREKRQAKQVLLILGVVQLGLAGIVYLTFHVKTHQMDTALPVLVGAALFWLILSGLIAITCCMCSVTECMKMSVNYANIDHSIRHSKEHRFSLFCLHLYQGVIVVGSIIIFAAAVDGIYLNTQDDDDVDPVFTARRPLRGLWNHELATFIFGLLLCLFQLGMAGVVQKTLVEPLIRAQNLQRQRALRVSSAGDHNTEQLNLVITTNPIADSPRIIPSAVVDARPLSVISADHASSRRLDLPPRYSSVGLPIGCRLLADSRDRISHGWLDLPPPQYSDVNREGNNSSPPPAFSTRRNTLQSLPPSYSVVNGFLPA